MIIQALVRATRPKTSCAHMRVAALESSGTGFQSRKLWVKPSSRKDSVVALVHRVAAPSAKRGACASKKGPTFLRVYAVPVLLLNLAFAGWDIVAANAAHSWLIYLGYAVIVTISLRLYLGYLDRYLYEVANREEIILASGIILRAQNVRR